MNTVIFKSTALIAAIAIFMLMCAGTAYGYSYELCLRIDKKIDALFDKIFEGCL